MGLTGGGCSKGVLARLIPTDRELERRRARYEAHRKAVEQLHEVHEALTDPAVPLSQVGRVITAAMAELASQLCDDAAGSDVAALNLDMRWLRRLHKAVLDVETLRKREDKLKIEGAKFKAAMQSHGAVFPGVERRP
jgi:hypothetical protein